jgi:hypothetical protein
LFNTRSRVMKSAGESHDEHVRPFLVRLVHTPLSDLLRCRVTGRYDVKGLLMRSGLPEPLQDYAFKVVLRTGLWRSEKIVVAQELVDKLADDLASAQSPEDLVDRQEPWKKAARRIRREKRRDRALVWRVVRRIDQSVGCAIVLLVVIYLAFLLRFMTGKPEITWDYLAEVNAEAKAVPEPERAWPVYREATLKLKPIPEGLMVVESWRDTERAEPLRPYEFVEIKPGEEHWDALLDYTAEIDEALDLVRQAAERPRVGSCFRDPADDVVPPVDFVGRGKERTLALPVPESHPVLPHVYSDHLRQIEVFAHLLRADVSRAAKSGDGDQFVADLKALVGIFRQFRRSGAPSNFDLVATRHMSFTCDALGMVLSEQAPCLTDEHLKELAASLDAVGDAEHFHTRLDWERARVRDTIQRMCTDNGHGGGHCTPQLLSMVWKYHSLVEPPSWQKRVNSVFVLLSVPVVGAGRREMFRACSEIIDEAEREGKSPLWERGESLTGRRLGAMSAFQIARCAPALLILRVLDHRVPVGGEFARQRYDAVRVAIALEQYRRKTGNWPERLEQLTPDLLPAVPPDRFDGKPIKYRLTDDRPVLYSIGVDRVDDGGELPDDENPCSDIWALPSEAPELRAQSRHRGDWILWPPMMR